MRVWVLGIGDPEIQVDWNLLPHQVNHSPCPRLSSLWRSQESKLIAFYLSSCYASVSLAKSRPARLIENLLFFLTESNTWSLLQHILPHSGPSHVSISTFLSL